MENVAKEAIEPSEEAAAQQAVMQAPEDTLALVRDLCVELEEQQIQYCHWKSTTAIDRSHNGLNDLDLLISRADSARFHAILSKMGFKEALSPEDKEQPGIVSYYGFDRPSGLIVHVHAHYTLVMGNDFSKNYHIPFERAYLENSQQQGLFRLPAPEMEFIALVIRMVLKHSTWDTMLTGLGKLSKSEMGELIDLQQRADPQKVTALLEKHLPFIPLEVFQAGHRAIQPGAPTLARMQAGAALLKALRGHARSSPVSDVVRKVVTRSRQGLKRRIGKLPKHRMATGGAIIAVVGGDGAGKTTAIASTYKWLSKYYDVTRLHMGKPEWAPTTKIIRAVLKVGQVLGFYKYVHTPFEAAIEGKTVPFPGYPWLIRQVLFSRDRYLTYCKARRLASNGELVICDRFPLKGVMMMDGPQAERMTRTIKRNWLVNKLIALENSYYQQMMTPELLIVLRLHPDLAVARKTDESAGSVRPRSEEIWKMDWTGTRARLVDSSQPKEDVLAEIKSLIWESL